MDTYRALRASADFFLASDGSYSGAAEQIAAERVARADRAHIRQSLQISELSGKLVEYAFLRQSGNTRDAEAGSAA